MSFPFPQSPNQSSKVPYNDFRQAFMGSRFFGGAPPNSGEEGNENTRLRLQSNPDRWFWIFWIGIQLGLGWLDYINMPPFGMHQGAQADRACVAWNFWHESMNFFLPRVMENRAAEGVAGMEFPIIPYLAALAYSVFGFHDIFYRLIVGLIVGFGMWAAWRILSMHIRSTLSKLALLAIFYLSPTLVFYTWNFLADPVALSLGMIALYHWIKWHYHIDTKRAWWFYLLFISLCGLIKVSFLIVHVAIILLLLTQKLKKPLRVKQNNDNSYEIIDESSTLALPKYPWYTLLLPIIPIVCWYAYAKKITETTGNTHFLQQINPSNSLTECIEISRYSFNTWIDSLYPTLPILGIIMLWVYSMIRFRKSLTLLEELSIWLLLGFGAVFILFQLQFRYHDYYFLSAWPFVFFAILALQQRYLNGKIFLKGWPALLSLMGLCILPFVHFGQAKKMLTNRFTANDYYCQNVVTEIDDLTRIGTWLKKVNVKDREVFVAFDPSPNTVLYLLETKGVRLASGYGPRLALEIYNAKCKNFSEKNRRLGYVITNDTSRWFSEYADTSVPTPNHQALFNQGKWFVYSIGTSLKK